MAEAAIKAAVESYVGSLITLTTKSGMRYEGYLHQVHAEECTIGFKKVKSFGTEERRGGFVVSPSDKIYEYVVFHGSDIKDLRVISLPSSQNKPSLLDDPAIIECRDSLPPPMTSATPSPSYLRGLIGPSNQLSQTQSPIASILGSVPIPVPVTKEAASILGPVPIPIPVSVTKEAVSILGTMDTVSRKFPFTPNFNAIADTNTIKLPQPLLSTTVQMSRALTMFNKDLDFDAMNEKFNKEDVWGLLGKGYKCEDIKKHEDGTNLDYCRLSYCEDDDFYDSFSCNKPNDGSARMNFSDRRKKDAETFGFSQTYQQADDGKRPHWAGGWKYNNARTN